MPSQHMSEHLYVICQNGCVLLRTLRKIRDSDTLCGGWSRESGVHTAHILLVDDSRSTLKVQRRLFERAMDKHGHRTKIDFAIDGADACTKVLALSQKVHGYTCLCQPTFVTSIPNLLFQQGECFSFITMDLSMPVLDGLSAAEIIRLHM